MELNISTMQVTKEDCSEGDYFAVMYNVDHLWYRVIVNKIIDEEHAAVRQVPSYLSDIHSVRSRVKVSLGL